MSPRQLESQADYITYRGIGTPVQWFNHNVLQGCQGLTFDADPLKLINPSIRISSRILEISSTCLTEGKIQRTPHKSVRVPQPGHVQIYV